MAASRHTLRRPLTHPPSWLQTGAPLWLCDVACTVPSVLLGAAALRGGNAAFLRATEALREERLALALALVLALTQTLSLTLTLTLKPDPDPDPDTDPDPDPGPNRGPNQERLGAAWLPPPAPPPACAPPAPPPPWHVDLQPKGALVALAQPYSYP